MRRNIDITTVAGLSLGLLGVLRLGRDITAPMAVHGTYTIAPTSGTGGHCLWALLADSILAVTQSGERVEVRLGRRAVRLDGHLTGNRLSAEGALPAIGACPTGKLIRFEGLAIRAGQQMRLDASLRAECVACGSLTFAASRPSRAPRSGS